MRYYPSFSTSTKLNAGTHIYKAKRNNLICSIPVEMLGFGMVPYIIHV